MIKNYSRFKITLLAACSVLALVLGSSLSATAQISYMTPADVKAEAKKGKKEAARLDSEYEDHLEITKRKHKRGGVDEKKKKAESVTDYNYDKEINAIEGEQPPVAESKKKKLLSKKKKEEK